MINIITHSNIHSLVKNINKKKIIMIKLEHNNE